MGSMLRRAPAWDVAEVLQGEGGHPGAQRDKCVRACSVTRLMTRVTGRPLSTAGWKVSNLMYLRAREGGMAL